VNEIRDRGVLRSERNSTYGANTSMNSVVVSLILLSERRWGWSGWVGKQNQTRSRVWKRETRLRERALGRVDSRFGEVDTERNCNQPARPVTGILLELKRPAMGMRKGD